MKKIILIILLVPICSLLLQAGGPWPKKKGKFYLKLSEWWIVFDQHYTDSGNIDPNVTTGIFNTFLYTEYGVTDRFTAIVNAPLFSRNYMNNLRSATTNDIIVRGEALNSIGDIDVGLKYGLTKPGAKVPLSVSLVLGLPTGATGKGELGNLQTGDGEFNQLLQLDIGQGFQIKESSAYVSGYVGVNNRTNGYSEEFRYGLEVGLGLFSNKLWVNSKLTAIESFKNGDTAETTTSTSIFANNSEFVSIGFEANYFINANMGVSAGYATAFSGAVIAAAPSYSVGFFYNLD